jgi:protein SCO1/2
MKDVRHTAACAIVLLFGFLLFYFGTDGFRAFTSETARVNRLLEEKPPFPEVMLEDSEGRTYPFSEFKGKYVFITFLYTSCTTVCPELEMNMSQVYERIPDTYIGEDIVFLSISFDPDRDTPAALNRYKEYFNSDGEAWRMARITDKAQLEALLDAFGVIVIPDGYGNFAHNSAFYLVDRQGVLTDVMDYKKVEEAARKIAAILDKETGDRG